MNPDLRGSAAHVLVDDISAPSLGPNDRHHLGAVLRLRAGELVTATDGLGRWVRCRWAGDGVLQVDGPIVEPAPTVAGRPVTVACAIPKGDRPEWIVEKLTEIGVDRIVWVETARGVVRWTGDRAAKNRDRLAKVARSAAMQSRRTSMPSVEGPLPLAALIAEAGTVVADPDGSAMLPEGAHTVVVGPEGGFDPSELPPDVPRVSLGSTVLRVETAAFLAGYLLVSR